MNRPHGSELELSAEKMHSLVEQAMRRIVHHLESLPDQPASYRGDVSDAVHLVRESIPQEGTDFAELMELLFERLIPASYNTAGPGYLAYIPGGGIFHSALADLISSSVNRYVGVWIAAPALAQLEVTVIRWFSDMIGFPPAARGLLTTGGSMANLTAVVTARRTRLPENFLRGSIYASDQVHHSVMKAAALAGFPHSNVVQIPSDDCYRVRLDDLQKRIQKDRHSGWEPFLIVGSAGTTNTGAVDDLSGLAQIRDEENLWLHVDAAYGGFFVLTERGRTVMQDIHLADSVTLDPHKALFLPYGNGCLLVREGEQLKKAHSIRASYMPPMQEDPDLVDFCEYSPELSRDFRGLRIWLPLKMHGIDPFRRNLDEKLDLTRWAADELRRIPELEVVAEPQLTVVAFRKTGSGHSPEELNRLNMEFLERINSRGRVFLTGTTVRGKFVLRLCVVSFRTHRDRISNALEDIRVSL